MPRAKKPTTTFEPGFTERIERSIRRLAQRQFNHARQPFTFHDLKLMFVPRDLRQMVTEAFATAAPTGTTFELNTSFMDHDICLQFRWRWDAVNGFLIPHSIGGSGIAPITFLQDDCPEALGQRYLTMLKDFIVTSMAFGWVIHTFELLNEQAVCRTPHHLRYYWPCIVPLLEMGGMNLERELADELRHANPKMAGKIAFGDNLSPELLMMTNQTVAASMLVEERSQPNSPVEYSITVPPSAGSVKGIT